MTIWDMLFYQYIFKKLKGMPVHQDRTKGQEANPSFHRIKRGLAQFKDKRVLPFSGVLQQNRDKMVGFVDNRKQYDLPIQLAIGAKPKKNKKNENYSYPRGRINKFKNTSNYIDPNQFIEIYKQQYIEENGISLPRLQTRLIRELGPEGFLHIGTLRLLEKQIFKLGLKGGATTRSQRGIKHGPAVVNIAYGQNHIRTNNGNGNGNAAPQNPNIGVSLGHNTNPPIRPNGLGILDPIWHRAPTNFTKNPPFRGHKQVKKRGLSYTYYDDNYDNAVNSMHAKLLRGTRQNWNTSFNVAGNISSTERINRAQQLQIPLNHIGNGLSNPPANNTQHNGWSINKTMNPPGWDTMIPFRGAGNPPNLVRMHMLNGAMGGSGNHRGNLAPGSTWLNGQHKTEVENKIKNRLNQGRQVEYRVDTHYWRDNPQQSLDYPQIAGTRAGANINTLNEGQLRRILDKILYKIDCYVRYSQANYHNPLNQGVPQGQPVYGDWHHAELEEDWSDTRWDRFRI